jgi:signal transduction histidine kinase
MSRLRTLYITLVFFVLMVMTSSALLSGACLLFLFESGLILDLRATPKVLMLVALMVSIVIGTVLTLVVGQHFLKPINQLIVATREVARGNFNVRVPELDADNELAGLIRSFNYMTAELAGKEMFHKDFINNFSHEFRTPIVSIRGFARQLKQPTLDEEKRNEYVDIIISESERLAHLSTNILLLTKLENQQSINDKKEYSLDEQLRDCILLLQHQWETKNISFQLELDPVQYNGNEEILSQAWLNLLGNAIKFSHPNGEIVVQCHDDGKNIKVKIADSGIGMDDETRQKIFEKFYQGDQARSTDGNGLGLSLVKRIVDLCGGTISVKSQVGKGSAFVVRLPKG